MTRSPQPPPPPPRPPAGPHTPKPPAGPKGTAEELIPVAVLAERWHCSKDHIYNLIATGDLRHVPLGIGRAKTRIPASAAAEFVARRSSKGRAA